MNKRSLLLCFFLLSSMIFNSQAEQNDFKTNENNWELLGPSGGYVLRIYKHPIYSSTIYAICSQSNNFFLYRTIDSGKTWKIIRQLEYSYHFQINQLLVYHNPYQYFQADQLLFHPNHSSTIYLATATGVHKSDNLGDSWSQLLNINVNCISSCILDSFLLYAGGYDGILYKSTDEGFSWIQLSTGVSQEIVSLAISPQNTNLLYVGFSKCTSYDNIGDKSLYKTENGGETWQNISPDTLATSIKKILINQENSSEIIIQSLGWYDFFQMRWYPGYILKSNNHGQSWEFTSDIQFETLLVNHNTKNEFLFTEYENDIHISENFGSSWKIVELNVDAEILDIISLDVVFSDHIDFYLGTNRGLYSYNPKDTTFLLKGVTDVGIRSIDSFFGENSILHTAGRGIYSYLVKDSLWEYSKSIPNAETSYANIIRVNPSNYKTVYLGTYYPNGAIFKSYDNGNNWSKTNLTDVAINDIAISSSDTNIVFAGGLEDPHIGGFYKSENAGKSWELLSKDYFIESIVIHPTNSNILFIGTAESGIFKSIDGGKNLVHSSLGIPTPFPWISDLIFDPFDFNIIYAASMNGIFKSVSDGSSWVGIDSGLDYLDVRSLEVDPLNPGFLYCGIYGYGVYQTIDYGDTWQAINRGWQSALVSSLVLDAHTRTLYAGTYDKSVWKYKFSTGPSDVELSAVQPKKFILFQNFPNPFNQFTNIQFILSKPNFVTLIIYNVAGQEIKTLINRYIEAGKHNIKWSAESLSSGLYFYKLKVGNFSETKKLIVQK